MQNSHIGILFLSLSHIGPAEGGRRGLHDDGGTKKGEGAADRPPAVEAPETAMGTRALEPPIRHDYRERPLTEFNNPFPVDVTH